MKNDETTVETQDEQTEGQTVEVEETTTEEAMDDSQSENIPPIPESEMTPQQRYDWRMSQAQTPEEKLKIATNHINAMSRVMSKKPKAPMPKAPQTASASNVEETATIAALQVNGMPDELVDQLKKVAKVQGISLIKAQTDPIFVAVKEKFEKDKKQASANLPASRGSGVAKPRKTVSSPGLTREEHMALAKES